MRALAILAALPLIACNVVSSDSDTDKSGVTGSGSGNVRTYQVADFSKVTLRGSDDIDVRVGSGFSVRAEGDPEVLEYIKIERDGDTLKVGRRNRSGLDWGDRSAKIYVTMPRIAGGSVAGSGDLTIDRAEGASFAANIAGNGNITIGTLAADAVDFNIAGNGDIKAIGTAKTVKTNIVGSGNVDAPKLNAAGADVSIAGSGDVRFDVDGNAKVAIMGSGNVDLGANATCSVSKMGSGDVRCGG